MNSHISTTWSGRRAGVYSGCLCLIFLGLVLGTGSGGLNGQTFPSVTGEWSGTATVVGPAAVVINSPNVCTMKWAITSQTGGQFSGTYLVSGGNSEAATLACATSGSGKVSGTVSVAGTFGGVAFSDVVALMQGCTRLTGGVYAGNRSDKSISVTTTEHIQCTIGRAKPEGDRSVTMSLRKP